MSMCHRDFCLFRILIHHAIFIKVHRGRAAYVADSIHILDGLVKSLGYLNLIQAEGVLNMNHSLSSL